MQLSPKLRYAILILLLGIPLLALQVAWSQPGIHISNIEATWHVVHTTNALSSEAASSHWLLPSVTLDNPLDKGVPWGATVPTPSGDLIYTSFYSPGFIFANLARKILGFLGPFTSLVAVNVLLGVLSVCLAYALSYEILGRLDISESRRAFSSFFGGALIALFSRESLVSHGIVYWPHSLYQIFLGLLLLALCRQLVSDREPFTRGGAALIFFLAYVGGLVEWTGIIFALVAAIVVRFIPCFKNTRLPVVLAFAALLSVGTIAIHFSLALGPKEFLVASLGRFAARSAKSASVITLVKGYAISYLPWLVACLIACIAAGSARLRAALGDATIRFSLLLCVLPLLENFLMLQHASQFSFDRLKAIFPLGAFLSLCIAVAPTLKRLFLIMVVAVSGISLLQWQNELLAGKRFSPVHASNLDLVGQVKERVSLECSVLSSSMKVRGYDNVLWGRAINEHIPSLDAAVSTALSQGGCAAVWIEGSPFAVDIPYFQKATIVRPGHEKIILLSKHKTAIDSSPV